MKGNIFGQVIEKFGASFSTGVARWELLARLGALGAAAILPVAFPQAQAPSTMPVRPYRIDTHNHFSASGFIAAIGISLSSARG